MPTHVVANSDGAVEAWSGDFGVGTSLMISSLTSQNSHTFIRYKFGTQANNLLHEIFLDNTRI